MVGFLHSKTCWMTNLNFKTRYAWHHQSAEPRFWPCVGRRLDVKTTWTPHSVYRSAQQGWDGIRNWTSLVNYGTSPPWQTLWTQEETIKVWTEAAHDVHQRKPRSSNILFSWKKITCFRFFTISKNFLLRRLWLSDLMMWRLKKDKWTFGKPSTGPTVENQLPKICLRRFVSELRCDRENCQLMLILSWA